MSQEIIVFIILAAVASYVLFTIIRKSRVKKTNPCGGCTGCELKQELTCSVSKTPHR